MTDSGETKKTDHKAKAQQRKAAAKDVSGEEFSWDLVDRMVKLGYISVHAHPRYSDVVIYNYTNRAQFDGVWNAATRRCRGLIVRIGKDGTRTVVACGFPKFHTWEQLGQTVQKGYERLAAGTTVTATIKMDGSLGIGYRLDRWEISTRGCFQSPQAKFATDLLYDEKVYGKSIVAKMDKLLVGRTPLFEIIGAGRIVVDYGTERKLVLLAVLETATGRTCPLTDFKDLGFPLVQSVAVGGCALSQDVKALLAGAGENAEGYVLHLAHPDLRFKVKFARYRDLHIAKCDLTNRRVWKILSSGDLDALLGIVPDEAHTWLGAQVDGLRKRFEETKANIAAKKLATEQIEGRKEIKAYLATTAPEISSAVFAAIDGRLTDAVIWKLLEPTKLEKCSVDIDTGDLD